MTLVYAAREGAVFMVGGGMPSRGDGGRATDTSRPHRAYGNGGTPITGNASEVSIGDAAFTSETHCRLSVFFFAVADKDFYDRSLTCRFFAKAKRQADKTAGHESRQ